MDEEVRVPEALPERAEPQGLNDWKKLVGEGAFSPDFHAASELIGKRWTGAIVRTLFHGHSRFREIRNAIPGISDRLLSERLKELSAEGIVVREPDGFGYVLTEKGRDLRLILREIAKWAHRWRATRSSGENVTPSRPRGENGKG